MKFDFAIGNPPYQDNAIGENDTYAPPVYNKFLDAAYAVADSVEMIHPARFLFNAGSTPKAWNEKMLNDPHFKVMHYEEDASKVFANTDIKGGVAITYRTSDAKYEPIVVFTKYPALNHILHKVNNTIDFVPMDTLVVTRTAYRLTEKLHQEHTEAMDQLSKGHPYDMSTNIFNRLPQFFFNEAPNDGNKYIRILGRENSQRVYKYIRSDYVNQPKNLFQYKIFLPSANGNGVFGETLTAPVLGIPGIGSTETFISVGWKGNATFDDGSGETFIDKDFHAYLRKSGIEQEKGKNNEWFHVDGATSKQMFRDFREDHGILKTTDAVIPYKLREEQQRAVTMTVDYQAAHKDGEFLWNAKPRFGKTLSVYDFVQKTGAEKVLIVTNRPAIANSWFSDYAKFLGSESGYLFVSEVDALKGKRGVLTREEYTHFLLGKDSENVKCIEFVSLQDMKGSIYFGGQYDKLGEVANMEWDILVIDDERVIIRTKLEKPSKIKGLALI